MFIELALDPIFLPSTLMSFSYDPLFPYSVHAVGYHHLLFILT